MAVQLALKIRAPLDATGHPSGRPEQPSLALWPLAGGDSMLPLILPKRGAEEVVCWLCVATSQE